LILFLKKQQKKSNKFLAHEKKKKGGGERVRAFSLLFFARKREKSNKLLLILTKQKNSWEMNELQKNKTKGELVHFLCFQEKNIFFFVVFYPKRTFCILFAFLARKRKQKKEKATNF